VGDIGKQSIIADNSTVDSASLRAKFKRTNSSVTPQSAAAATGADGESDFVGASPHSTPLAFSADNVGNKRADRSDSNSPKLGRRATFKSLRPSATFSSDTNLEYDELYEANKVIKCPGYCLETLLDDVEEFMKDGDIAETEMAYSEWFHKYFINHSTPKY